MVASPAACPSARAKAGASQACKPPTFSTGVLDLRYITRDCAAANALEPEYGHGPFLPVCADDLAAFNDAFSDELDSAFLSDICCCDWCYDDFKAHWPDVTIRIR